jgi:cytochrome c biogenesis protein CcmG/thiol:disulfide interchange protein DsbE
MGNNPLRAGRFSLYAAVLAGLLLASGPAFAQDPLLHKPAPSFVRNDLSGQPMDLSAYRGKVVLLNFWATWCAPCQLEMPRFAAWQKQYGPQGLQIIGVSMDDEPEGVRKLANKLRLNYPVVMGDEQLGTLYGGILGLPVTFFVDRQGQVVARFQGETNLNAMEEQIQQLLASR